VKVGGDKTLTKVIAWIRKNFSKLIHIPFASPSSLFHVKVGKDKALNKR